MASGKSAARDSGVELVSGKALGPGCEDSVSASNDHDPRPNIFVERRRSPTAGSAGCGRWSRLRVERCQRWRVEEDNRPRIARSAGGRRLLREGDPEASSLIPEATPCAQACTWDRANRHDLRPGFQLPRRATLPPSPAEAPTENAGRLSSMDASDAKGWLCPGMQSAPNEERHDARLRHAARHDGPSLTKLAAHRSPGRRPRLRHSLRQEGAPTLQGTDPVGWASVHECTLSRVSEEAARAASSALAMVDTAEGLLDRDLETSDYAGVAASRE
jgi:hypothetical protein